MRANLSDNICIKVICGWYCRRFDCVTCTIHEWVGRTKKPKQIEDNGVRGAARTSPSSTHQRTICAVSFCTYNLSYIEYYIHMHNGRAFIALSVHLLLMANRRISNKDPEESSFAIVAATHKEQRFCTREFSSCRVVRPRLHISTGKRDRIAGALMHLLGARSTHTHTMRTRASPKMYPISAIVCIICIYRMEMRGQKKLDEKISSILQCSVKLIVAHISSGILYMQCTG